MNFNLFLFDVAVLPGGSVTGAVLAIVFFLVLLAVALIAFKMLKRTMKMAFRMIIVAAILLIALVGAISLMVFSGSSGRSKPPVNPASQTRPR